MRTGNAYAQAAYVQATEDLPVYSLLFISGETASKYSEHTIDVITLKPRDPPVPPDAVSVCRQVVLKDEWFWCLMLDSVC